MNWRGNQAEARRRYLSNYSETGAADYDAMIGLGVLNETQESALTEDFSAAYKLRPGNHVLDVGAGTGALSLALMRLEEIELTALEPSAAMLDRLRKKDGLRSVSTVEGFCDSTDDCGLFPSDNFDVIASRKVVNGLFDPLTAFRNWYSWLKSGGSVVAIDGLFDRGSWTGDWAREVDTLPFSACQSTAMTPYLLESVGFKIESVAMMAASNPTTRTPHYIVVATKPKVS